MSPRKKQDSDVIGADFGRLAELLSRIPTDDLVSFIAHSGIDREEARELCDIVRSLKP